MTECDIALVLGAVSGVILASVVCFCLSMIWEWKVARGLNLIQMRMLGVTEDQAAAEAAAKEQADGA